MACQIFEIQDLKIQDGLPNIENSRFGLPNIESLRFVNLIVCVLNIESSSYRSGEWLIRGIIRIPDAFFFLSRRHLSLC